MEAKGGCLFLVGILVLSSFASAGFFDWVGNITGHATSETTTLTITVGNNAPTITQIQSLSAQTPSESSTKKITLNFNVTDLDGVSNINASTVAAQFERSGEATRTNASCVLVTEHNFTTAEYSCSIDMWYFDGSGAWTINVSAKDINDAEARNTSTSFTYNQLTSMVMSPTSTTWGVLSLTDTNVGSNNDPVVINNTGNDMNLSIEVLGHDLQGLVNTDDYIYASNFSIDVVTEGCLGTTMADNVSTAVANAALNKGNNTINNGDDTSGQEELFFCLKGLPDGITAQEYSSNATGPWMVQITA